jgi:hypothetical protein
MLHCYGLRIARPLRRDRELTEVGVRYSRHLSIAVAQDPAGLGYDDTISLSYGNFAIQFLLAHGRYRPQACRDRCHPPGFLLRLAVLELTPGLERAAPPEGKVIPPRYYWNGAGLWRDWELPEVGTTPPLAAHPNDWR